MKGSFGFIKGGFVALGAFLFNYKPSPPTQLDSRDERQRSKNSRYTILVADDDVVTNRLIQGALAKAGFSVLTSGNGAKALDMIRYSRRVNVLLLDYHMPTLNGSDTIGFIKKYFPNVKVIGVTGVDPAQLPDSYRSGIDKLLSKPINSSVLIDAINSVLAESRVTQ